MKDQQVLNCVDAGSEFCPCYLSETGECIMCSQLQGETFCDCRNWKGVCVYQEYAWNREKMKEGRKSHLCSVLHKERISDSVIILTIQVNKTLARELNEPGAYVFLRGIDDPFFFDTPMSIMRSDILKETVDIAVQLRGIKTKSLDELGDDVVVRGPYWNGLLGMKYIKGLRNSKALLLTRGIGQAPALSVARKLLTSGNEVEVVLDPGRAGINFVEKEYVDMGCTVTVQKILDLETLKIPAKMMKYIESSILEKGIKLIYSGGSDKLHEGVSALLKRLNTEVYFTCSNDAKFCCGEGVCGSCHTRLPNGKRIKTCKTQISPVEIFGGR